MSVRPIRILEIGSGRISAIPHEAAKRHPQRDIQYAGIDAEHAGVNGEQFIDRARVSETYHFRQLNTANPDHLRRQLDGLLGPMRFDEIHWHMPSHHQFEITRGGVLKALSERLIHGGRLFHVFQHQSPAIGQGLEQPDFSFQPFSMGEIRRVHAENTKTIQTIAATTGMSVTQYAVRPFRTKYLPGSEIGLFFGMAPLFGNPEHMGKWFDGSERNHDAINQFVRNHSNDAQYAAHVLELVKEGQPSATKVTRRK